MKLLLVRHGETIENAAGIVQGLIQGTLSELGKKQTKKIALRLKDEIIDFIYSSDLARAAYTAKEIQKQKPKTPIKYSKQLREWDCGKFAGMTLESLGWEKDDSKTSTPGFITPPDGETLEQLQERARKFLKKIAKKHPHNIVLFVTHGTLGRNMIGIMDAKDIAAKDRIKLKNTSLSIFEIDENLKTKTILLNCTKHLE